MFIIASRYLTTLPQTNCNGLHTHVFLKLTFRVIYYDDQMVIYHSLEFLQCCMHCLMVIPFWVDMIESPIFSHDCSLFSLSLYNDLIQLMSVSKKKQISYRSQTQSLNALFVVNHYESNARISSPSQVISFLNFAIEHL